MAEATRMKDLIARIDTIFSVMDQREERLLATMDERDERVKLVEQSLSQISKCLEALQLAKPITATIPMSSGSLDLDHTIGHHEGSEQRHLHPVQTRSVRVDFPQFDGEDVLNWIFKAERFFHYYDIHDPHRLEIAAIHFDGPVIPWFQMLMKQRQ